MNPREVGFLLLTAKLGDPTRPTMTVMQFRTLALRVHGMKREDPNRELTDRDLLMLGYSLKDAERILRLLSEKERLSYYIDRGKSENCTVLSRISEGYPDTLRKRLQLDAPASLWARGNLELLNYPAISLVGSRELREENAAFAQEVGKQAALQDYTLISGNARGADRQAQESCLQHGGRVISVIADRLIDNPVRENVLYLSEEGYDLPFSSQRALSRNRVIHALPTLGVIVAQTALRKGGTWSGTEKNLKNCLSPVFCFGDGSAGMQALCALGGTEISISQLKDLYALQGGRICLF